MTSFRDVRCFFLYIPILWRHPIKVLTSAQIWRHIKCFVFFVRVLWLINSNSFLRAIFPPRCISDIMIWLWIALASSAGSSQEQNVSTFNFFILNNQSSEEAGMWSEGWDRLLLNNRWGYLFWEQLREASIIFFCSLLCSYYHDTGCCCWIINEVIYSASAGS